MPHQKVIEVKCVTRNEMVINDLLLRIRRLRYTDLFVHSKITGILKISKQNIFLSLNQEPVCVFNFLLREKYQYSEFFWSVFSHIRTEYGEMRSIEYGYFSHSVLPVVIQYQKQYNH